MNTGGSKTRGPATVCKICWRSVYGSEMVAWAVTPYPGLVHERCLKHQEEARK